jgi:hypothetical protein
MVYQNDLGIFDCITIREIVRKTNIEIMKKPYKEKKFL